MDFWAHYGGNLEKLGIYGVGIAAYTIVVTMLYVPMGHRLMFAKQMGEERVATTGRRFLYILMFPLVSFAFFLVVACTMQAFNNPEITGGGGGIKLQIEDILVIAMATVLAIRICAYVNETAADELAKVMPLGLLGLVLVTGGVDKVGDVVSNLLKLADKLDLILIFFVAVVLVEFLLRLVYELSGRPGRKRPHPPPARPPPPGASRPPPKPVTFQRRP